MGRKFKNYWFVNGNLHKYIRRLPDDLVETFDFDANKYKQYYSYVWNSSKEHAYQLMHFAEWFDRHPDTVGRWIEEGTIPRGHMAWSLKNPDKLIAEFYTEDEVWEVWEIVRNIHVGRPRKDGLVTPRVLSRQEMRATLSGDSIVYIKKGGELIPVWKELT